jgi:sugar/nucleoside kinase (ribokinase family)
MPANRNAPLDVLGLGCVAVDELLYVEGYPPADSKGRVLGRERQCGGQTATALVAAARLGSRCAYAGVLGDDECSQFVIRRMEQEGIDLQYLVRRAEARPIRAVVIVDQARPTRTIFYDLTGAVGADPALPAAETIRSTRVLLVDQFGVEGMIRAARLARTAGAAVVADFEGDPIPTFDELIQLVDHLIVSHAFATALTGEECPAAAALALLQTGHQVVAVTCGADGCWYCDATTAAAPCHQAAFPVAVLDTTGCGDVFHGAYASALARGVDLAERIRFASAAAALKAARTGGQAGIPTRATVEAFLDPMPMS